MTNCQNLYYLSTIACKLSDCLTEQELTVLSADLVVLGDMLVNILSRESLCKDTEATTTVSTCSTKH